MLRTKYTVNLQNHVILDIAFYVSVYRYTQPTLLERSQVQLDLASKMKKAVVLTQQHDFDFIFKFYNAAGGNWQIYPHSLSSSFVFSPGKVISSLKILFCSYLKYQRWKHFIVFILNKFNIVLSKYLFYIQSLFKDVNHILLSTATCNPGA